ncbi:hypothetical protein Kpol_1028p79 [Vanderwaltozyma polyspora DSM 70294]|uniref:alpha-1,2-Mannosidase n=1 Tax=Vanderwaltozyma polyspora (strain ATCC 22028 / DSM 70294 / BCRC 21397 / CBS 2163 / NBRC 10782 / NRRL Y-8283 / UCD 57-17) TaxID=436907 RepID=A7TG46_VANPO|nr:uncharacterized protein Kpol_1028p79 [Vanderwaltozyma polyspora DSM 70294]EDO18803.1 hypothetical protein Kpol_1028p79 [Vanderwaltozyma polyspora DSM 70294]
MFVQAVFILALAYCSTLILFKDTFQLPFQFRARKIDAAAAKESIELAFLDSWNDYVKFGWGFDVYGPITGRADNMPRSGDPLGWMIVDTLDTMMLMYNSSVNHKDEFLKSIEQVDYWIEHTLNYDMDSEISVFETTIRMLGGLLSSYYLATELNVGSPKMYLDKAVDLGDRLSMAFVCTDSGIPYSSVNLHSGECIKNHVDDGASSTAEFTTLQMEFKYLSFLTGNDTYWKLSEMVYPPLYKVNDLLGDKYLGLVPIYTYPDTARFMGEYIRMGSRGDSFYEYLLKQYLLTKEDLYYKLYRASMNGMKRKLVSKSNPSGFTYIGERPFGINNAFVPKMDHLVCFMGGLLAMGATNGLPITEARNSKFWNKDRAEDWKLAEEFTHTCYQMYAQTGSGLAPEIVVFNDNTEFLNNEASNGNWWKSPTGDFYIKPLDKHNLQRPETVESIMFMYQLSKDEKYRRWGKEILDSFLEHSSVIDEETKRPKYVSLFNCVDLPTQKKDNMESFWLAETLKYLYLLFEDEVDLSKIVFNTEAHPLPVLNTSDLNSKNLKTGWSL